MIKSFKSIYWNGGFVSQLCVNQTIRTLIMAKAVGSSNSKSVRNVSISSARTALILQSILRQFKLTFRLLEMFPFSIFHFLPKWTFPLHLRTKLKSNHIWRSWILDQVIGCFISYLFEFFDRSPELLFSIHKTDFESHFVRQNCLPLWITTDSALNVCVTFTLGYKQNIINFKFSKKNHTKWTVDWQNRTKWCVFL